MFDNIGKKLKGLALFLCWGGIILSIILGLLIFGVGNIYGVLTMVLGPLSSWISSWIIYAIGEIAENTQIKRNDREISEKKRNDRDISEKKRIESVFKSYSSNQASTIRKCCPFCGETVTSKICSMCGKENNLFT